MSDLMIGLSYMAALVLFPLVPAFVLFKALPSSAETSGPLHGMHVKLGGAFGGYFILLVVLAAAVPKPPHVDYFTVKGKLALGVDSTASPALWSDQVRFSVVPPTQGIHRDGMFYVTFPYRENADTYPSILVETARCGSARIPIPAPGATVDIGDRQYRMKYHHLRHQILIEEPVVLEPFPTASARDTARLACASS